MRDARGARFPFPPSAAFPGPPVKRSAEAGSPGGDPGRPAKPGCGPLTRLLDVRRDRAGDARPQDDVQRPQAPQQPPTHGSPPPLGIDRAPSERSGRRLPGSPGCASAPRPLGTPRLAGPAAVRARCGAGSAARRGAGGRRGAGRPPAAEGSSAGGRLLPPVPGVCARGRVVGPGARVTHSTSPGAAGGNRKLLANSWAGPLAAPEPSPSPRSRPGLALS